MFGQFYSFRKVSICMINSTLVLSIQIIFFNDRNIWNAGSYNTYLNYFFDHLVILNSFILSYNFHFENFWSFINSLYTFIVFDNVEVTVIKTRLIGKSSFEFSFTLSVQKNLSVVRSHQVSTSSIRCD